MPKAQVPSCLYCTGFICKKSKAGRNGELPKRLVDEFSTELSEPLSIMLNNITKAGHWPQHWKLEHGIPLKKIPEPVNEK